MARSPFDYEYDWDTCTYSHLDVAGPNMDIGQCSGCGMPCGVRRPWGESFGWHAADCSLPIQHIGYCAHGGEGHEIPEGWKIRG